MSQRPRSLVSSLTLPSTLPSALLGLMVTIAACSSSGGSKGSGGSGVGGAVGGKGGAMGLGGAKGGAGGSTNGLGGSANGVGGSSNGGSSNGGNAGNAGTTGVGGAAGATAQGGAGGEAAGGAGGTAVGGADAGGAGGTAAGGAGGGSTAVLTTTTWRGVIAGSAQTGSFVLSSTGKTAALIAANRRAVSAPLLALPAGTQPITGTITFTGSAAFPVTGTLDLASGGFTATGTAAGGAITLTGTVAGTVVSGTYAGAGGSGMFSGQSTAAGAAVTLYCGTYAGDDAGVWNLTRAGNVLTGATQSLQLTGTVSSAAATVGAVTGNGLTLTSPQLPAATPLAIGAISATAAQGTWTNGTSTGTWMGSLCPMGACNAITNAAAVISKVTHAGPTPPMSGGTIADGTYFLTAMDKYNGMTGSATHQETWVFAGNSVQAVLADSDSTQLQGPVSGTYSISGNMLTINLTCPKVVTIVSPFTVTASNVQVVNSDDPNEVHTFTQQ